MFKQSFSIIKKAAVATSVLAALNFTTQVSAQVYQGHDLNSSQSDNADIAAIYSANRGSNGGGDQSLQFGDIVRGTVNDDLLIGGLGIDILLGGDGNDILIGGTEDFNPLNRDRALGHAGDDSFLWAPGDGNDFFDGGEGEDVLFMTLIGELKDSEGNTEGAPFFSVNPPSANGSQDFDGIYVNEAGSPVIDPIGPGFCEIVERDDTNTTGLEELGLDHLVRFVLRGPRAAFDAADPSTDPATLDNGLRVAIHLKNVEFLVCAGQTAGEIKIMDLRSVPAQEIDSSSLPAGASALLSTATQP